MNYKTRTLGYCGKFIQDIAFQILSESADFYRRYHENILAHFFLGRTRGFS